MAANFRFDRAVGVKLCHRICRLSARAYRARVPILMYHGICDGTSSRHRYYETSTSPRVFAAQMKYLRDNGYRALDLDEAIRSLVLGENLYQRVVITFHDGFRDFYTTAYPILKGYDLLAAMFIPAGFISDERLTREGKEYMTWSEVWELQPNGIRIGSHTVSHPQLKLLAAREIDEETGRSGQIIEDKAGTTGNMVLVSLCLPRVREGLYPRAQGDSRKARVSERRLDRHRNGSGRP